MKGLLKREELRPRSIPLVSEQTTRLQDVTRALLEMCGHMTYFKLTKLMYLVDLLALKRLGRTVGSEVYLRQVDGPWPPALDKALRAMEGFEVRRYFAHRIPMIDIGPSPRSEIHSENDILEIVAEISHKYREMSNSAIKTVVYRTEPMRFILEEEEKGKDMRNKPVLYKDKTVADLIK
jgi:uncharacterized phage-associated protein